MVAPSRGIESLKVAARWPGADRATIITLATRLASVRADADGYAYFQQEADAHPGQALPLALAGFSQARLGTDADAALAKLDQAAQSDLGPPPVPRGARPGRAPAEPEAGRAGGCRSRVRPGRARPVPAGPDPRRVPGARRRLRHARPGGPGGRGAAELGPRLAPVRLRPAV